MAELFGDFVSTAFVRDHITKLCKAIGMQQGPSATMPISTVFDQLTEIIKLKIDYANAEAEKNARAARELQALSHRMVAAKLIAPSATRYDAAAMAMSMVDEKRQPINVKAVAEHADFWAGRSHDRLLAASIPMGPLPSIDRIHDPMLKAPRASVDAAAIADKLAGQLNTATRDRDDAMSRAKRATADERNDMASYLRMRSERRLILDSAWVDDVIECMQVGDHVGAHASAVDAARPLVKGPDGYAHFGEAVPGFEDDPHRIVKGEREAPHLGRGRVPASGIVSAPSSGVPAITYGGGYMVEGDDGPDWRVVPGAIDLRK